MIRAQVAVLHDHLQRLPVPERLKGSRIDSGHGKPTRPGVSQSVPSEVLEPSGLIIVRSLAQGLLSRLDGLREELIWFSVAPREHGLVWVARSRAPRTHL